MNEQLGKIITELDNHLNDEIVKNLFVFGDVTSTLAGAITAKNNNIRCLHVEAGLRSRNLDMPEERNRMMVDAICDKLYTPSSDAVQNLLGENVAIEKIKNVGNIMIDTLIKSTKSLELDQQTKLANDSIPENGYETQLQMKLELQKGRSQIEEKTKEEEHNIEVENNERFTY